MIPEAFSWPDWLTLDYVHRWLVAALGAQLAWWVETISVCGLVAGIIVKFVFEPLGLTRKRGS